MALTTAQRVRLKIQDAPVIADDTYTFDGSASAYNMPHVNLTSASAFIAGSDGQWSATGGTFNITGYVTFDTAYASASAFRTRYVHSNFSDAEISDFTAVGGGVDGAAIQAIEALMFDAVKRARWMAPDGSQFDDVAAQAHLRGMYNQLKSAQADDAIAGGGMNSWSMNQERYP